MLEQVHRPRKVVHDLFLGFVVYIAARLERRVARPVLAPLVFPEAFVGAILIFPEDVHVIEHVGAARGLQDLGDVGVLPGFVAVFIVGAVAVVWPEREKRVRKMLRR